MEDEGGIMIPELASNRPGPVQALRDLLLKEAARPFKLMQGPLLRVKLVQVSLRKAAPYSRLKSFLRWCDTVRCFVMGRIWGCMAL